MNERFEAERCVFPDHPALPGHFPGHSVVPAVVLLDMVRDVLEQWRPGIRIAQIIQAKFQRPLAPGIPFTVRLSMTPAETVRFDCWVEDVRFASGLIQVGEAP